MMENSMISHGLYDFMRLAETAASSAALRAATTSHNEIAHQTGKLLDVA